VLIIGALLPIRPVDLPVEIAIAVFALALPLNVTGLVLLRVVQDVKPVGFEEGIVRVFQEAGFTPGEQQIPSLTTLEAVRKRGTRNVLYTALGILTLSGVLTLVGMVAALWHVAWWIAVAFGVMVFICQIIIQIVMVTSQPRASAEEKAERRRQGEVAIKQAKEQARQAKERARQAKG
jgi:MFS family permease